MKVTGSKARICLFGSLTDKQQQLYRQYEKINSASFIQYTKKLVNKYQRIVYCIDRAPWHTSKMTEKYLQANRDRIHIVWFPKGFPESNPVEETWKQGKYDARLGAKLHYTFTDFKMAVSLFYRTTKFKLDLYKYLCL